jgi:DNA-binding NarL/FixJ family response regulator
MSSEPHRRPRVLLADDDASVCNAVSNLLSPSYDVLGCVADATSLFDAAAELRPDVVVLDFSLTGGLTGIEICRRLSRTWPEMSVIVFTAHDDAEISRLALEAGASAYVWKLQAANDLPTAIQRAIDA